MKTISCKQLGGACDVEFKADTFDEVAAQSKQHGMEMFQAGDAAHLQAMAEMKHLMEDPAAMMKWFEEKRQQFDALTED